MDWFGNAPHGVVLPYRYFTTASWAKALAAAGLRETLREEVPGLYPFPFSILFGGCSSLHDFSRASDWNNEPHEFGLGTLGMYLAAMNKFPEARRFQEQATRLNLRRG
jgi:hypothetical protein